MGNYMKEFCKELREGKGYNWISNNYHKLNIGDCVDIIKELIYAIHNQVESSIEEEEIFGNIVDTLLTMYDDCYEESEV